LAPWIIAPLVLFFIAFFWPNASVRANCRKGLWSVFDQFYVGGIRSGATKLGQVGFAVFLAILFGRIGIALAGRVGLVGGEYLGAFLAGALSAVIVGGDLPFFSPRPPGFSQWRYWSRPLLLLGMGSVSMLWFLFADGPTGFALRRVDHSPGLSHPVIFSPDGRFAVECGPDGAIRLWNVEAGRVERDLEGRAEMISSVAFSADGSKLLAGSTDGSVRLWNVETGRVLRRFTRDGAQPRGHPADRGRLAEVLRRFTRNGAQQFAVFPDGQLALAGSKDNALLEMAVRRMPWARRKALAGTENNTIKIWNLNTGAETGCLTGHEDLVSSVAFSPDGRRVLSGSFDGTMRLWDVANTQEIRRFQRHTGWVTCVAFCPDGRRAIAGYYDWSIRLWDLETGDELHCFDGHHGTVTSLAVSPDGHSFLSGSFDCTMRLWDLDGGGQRCVFRGDPLPVISVGFSAEGRSAVSWCMDGTMRLWEPKK